MADDRSRDSIKNPEQYEALRDQGASKEKAARIANADNPGHRGGKAEAYEEWSVDALYERAQEIDIEGRADMNKAELIKALRNH